MQAPDDESTRLCNCTVPAVQHVPRSVYESVYALQLGDLVRLEGQAWDEVQDRLLGTLSVDHMRPARVVVEALTDEATDRWRTDNRGKPEAKQLEKPAGSCARRPPGRFRRRWDAPSAAAHSIRSAWPCALPSSTTSTPTASIYRPVGWTSPCE
ncbi:MAG: hypothetical protein BRD55_07025 [Bacteroidetes bacterium SW_9_63_38]|nr:MAG: hypothetical protein BRD55_07025 [Bacteroidetes bacterium SW_9_63_38]